MSNMRKFDEKQAIAQAAKILTEFRDQLNKFETQKKALEGPDGIKLPEQAQKRKKEASRLSTELTVCINVLNNKDPEDPKTTVNHSLKAQTEALLNAFDVIQQSKKRLFQDEKLEGQGFFGKMFKSSSEVSIKNIFTQVMAQMEENKPGNLRDIANNLAVRIDESNRSQMQPQK